MAVDTEVKEEVKTDNRPRSRVGRELAVLGLWWLVALAFTWPLALNFNQAVPGEDKGDAWQMVWNLWWVRYALENGQPLFQTDLIFHPQGTSLYLHALNAFNGLLSLPVQYVAGAGGGAANGAVAGYNFIVFFSLTFAAYGAFCLARYLWKDPLAALAAGLAYGFSTYTFAHLLGHLNLVATEFIPFYLLFFFKALHEPRKPTNRLLSSLSPHPSALLAVAFLVALTFLELQYVLYMAIFSVLYLLYVTLVWLWQKVRPKQAAFKLWLIYWHAALVAGLFGLVTLPFTLSVLSEALNNPNTVPLRQENIYSADLLAYFYPSPFHPLWGNLMSRAIQPFTATLLEKVVFPGFTVYLLLMAGLGLVAWQGWQKKEERRKKKEEKKSPANNKATRPLPSSPLWWLLVAGVFALLSFGPRLHINGIERGPKLPGAFIYEVPILNITRVPSRFAVVALLALGLLAAWGLSRVGMGLRHRQGRYQAVAGVVLLALAFELLPAPYPLTFYKIPAFYDTLAADPRRDYSIMEVPLNYGPYQYETHYLKAQMTHRKPLLNGYISRNPVFPPYYGVPVFDAFRNLRTRPGPDLLPAQPADVGVLRYFGVRYIIIRKDIIRGNELVRAFEIVSQLLPGQGPVADSPELAAYEIPPGPKADFFYNLVLPTWYEAERGSDGRVNRWAQSSVARVDFWSATPRQLEIEFPTWSFHEPHPLEFRLNGKMIEQTQVGLEPQTVRLKLDLQPGQNQLSLHIGGRATRPADLAPGPDTRSLTIGVGQIKLLPNAQ